MFAQDLIAHGFRNAQGLSFPLYFEGSSNRWAPLLSVYIHAISTTLFGKSVFVTRTTQAVISLLAPLAVAMILKQVFQVAHLVGRRLVAGRCARLVPAFAHRFRDGMMVSFFACFLWFYLLYRTRSPSLSLSGDLVRRTDLLHLLQRSDAHGFVGAVLALSDIRYHLKTGERPCRVSVLIALLALPVLRFRATQSSVYDCLTLRTMDSYWFHDLTLAQKIEQFMRTWAQGSVRPIGLCQARRCWCATGWRATAI